MQMRMMTQRLTPGVQHRQKANLCPEVFRIGGDGVESFGRTGEKQVVNNALVLQGDHGQLFWQCEHDMEVGHGTVSETGVDPTPLGQ